MLNTNLLYEILNEFNIHPKNLSYYLEALTHPSYAHEHQLDYNYQRLEFLGDSVISYVISVFLYKHQAKINEGLMSQIKINLERSQTLAKFSNKLKLDQLVLLGNGIKTPTNNVKEDIFEAFIGAIYLDQGIDKVLKIFNVLIFNHFDLNIYLNFKSYKSQFQEYISSNEAKKFSNNTFQNKIIYKSYLNNDEWNSELYFNNILYGVGSGKKKVDAEENAAKDAIDKCHLQ